MICLWFVYGLWWAQGVCLWFVYGLFMVFCGGVYGFLGAVYGLFMVCLWFVYGFFGGGVCAVCLWFVYGFLGGVYGLLMVFGGGRLWFVYGLFWVGVYDLFMVYLWFGGVVSMICSWFIYCLGEGVYDLFTICILIVWREVLY